MGTGKGTFAMLEDTVKFLIDLPYLTYIFIKALLCVFTRIISTRRKSLDGETVLVTGAAMGLGKSVVLQLAGRANITLVLWDINKDALEDTADECRWLGARVHSYVVDLSNQQDIKKTADKVRRDVGPVTILYNNAGIVRYENFLDIDPAIEEKIIQVNLMSNFWTIRAFLPGMIHRGKGHVVTTSSGRSFQISKYRSAYIASKFAQRGFLESLQLEMRLHPKKPEIKFSTVYPAYIQTSMVQNLSFKPRYSMFAPMDPKYVAAKVIDGIEKESYEIFIPRSIKLLSMFYRLIPSSFLDALDELLYEHHFQNADHTKSDANQKESVK